MYDLFGTLLGDRKHIAAIFKQNKNQEQTSQTPILKWLYCRQNNKRISKKYLVDIITEKKTLQNYATVKSMLGDRIPIPLPYCIDCM